MTQPKTVTFGTKPIQLIVESASMDDGKENGHMVSDSASLATLTVDEFQSDCNGHSSPDSGVNDMSYERHSTTPCTAASAAGDASSADGALPSAQPKRIKHRVAVVADERIHIQMGDTIRQVAG